MRTLAAATGLLGLTLAAAGPLRAGVYETPLHPLPYPLPESFAANWANLIRLRTLPVPELQNKQRNADHDALLRAAVELEVEEKRGTLGATGRVRLGAAYLRLNRPGDAAKVLQDGDLSHFLTLANLATAYAQLGEWGRAIDYQSECLARWPAAHAPWTARQLAFYRRAEVHYLALLRNRQREQRDAPPGQPGAWAAVDPLFPAVRFANAAGVYEPGKIAPRMADQLPPDALEIVLQLLYWLPNDGRLYWLYGELLNARGDADHAYTVLDYLSTAQGATSVRELQQHRQILQGPASFLAGEVKPRRRALLFALAPRPCFGAPGAGDLAAAAGWAAAPLVEQNASAPDVALPDDPPRPGASLLPNWPQLLISFVVGMVFAMLLGAQWRQWTRRRR